MRSNDVNPRTKKSPHPERPVSHLDSVLDLPGVVSDDEGRLHDSGELDVTVSFMLTLELVQQGLIGGLRETRGQRDHFRGKVLYSTCFKSL